MTEIIRLYEVTMEGTTQGWNFSRTGYLAIYQTFDSIATQNGVNPVDVLLQSGSPALQSESGAIQFATNSGAHIDAGNAQLDLTFVTLQENDIIIEVDTKISATGSNLFNSTSSLISLYQIFDGGMALRFSEDGSNVNGIIDIQGTFSLEHRPASYRATISGELVSGTNEDFSSSSDLTAEEILDFNQDGNSDLIWRNEATGLNVLWYMDNTALVGSAFVPPVPNADWQIKDTGDFNSDGLEDIVWRNRANGLNIVWYMSNEEFIGSAFFTPVSNTDWDIAGVSDLNNDGQDDLLWRNSRTGVNLVWYMSNTQRIGDANLAPVPNSDWEIKGVGDFNRDGSEDLVWRNKATGQNSIWYMNGAQRIGGADLNTVRNPDWDIAGVNDFNGDNKPDLVWRNSASGRNIVWYMDNNTFLNSADFTPVPNSDWTVVA